jgi:hypothetical protein
LVLEHASIGEIYKWKDDSWKNTFDDVFNKIGNQVAISRWKSLVNPYCYYNSDDRKLVLQRENDMLSQMNVELLKKKNEAQQGSQDNSKKRRMQQSKATDASAHTGQTKWKINVGDNSEANGPDYKSNGWTFKEDEYGINYNMYKKSGFETPKVWIASSSGLVKLCVAMMTAIIAMLN